MKNRKKLVQITALGLVLGSTMATANAAQNVTTSIGRPAGIAQADRQAEEAALKGGYQTWKSYIESTEHRGILESINESNFDRYAQARQLQESGQGEGARVILEELGIKGEGRGGGRGFSISREQQAAIEAAIKAGDYSTWESNMKAFDAEGRYALSLNETVFAALVKAFGMREAGDMDGAMQALSDADVPMELSLPGEMMHSPISTADAEALKLALENSDYNAWKTLIEKVEGDKAQDYLTEEKFIIVVRAYKLQASAEAAGARTLMEKSGLPGWLLGREGGRHGRPQREGAGVDQAALMRAYESSDYDGWKTLMSARGGKILELIDQDNFARYAQAKVLQSEGKTSEAEAILGELGLPFHGGHGPREVRTNTMATSNS